MTTDFIIIDHTADIVVRSFGESLEALFASAARGMTAVMFGEEVLGEKPAELVTIEIAADDDESLLVDWLSELLYRMSVEYRAGVYFDVVLEERSEAGRRLRAEAGFVPAQAEVEIKAVTYHGLRIERIDGIWQAEITYDL